MANVFGTDAAETLDALDGVTNAADTIFGFGGNDTIFGLGGNDLILGGAGGDSINGGTGTDTASYSDSGAAVTVSLESGHGSGGTAEGDTLTSIENLTGSAHDDFLIGNAGNNVLVGLEDNDILKGGGGSDTLYGDSGSDTLKGGGGADTINGGSGIDTAKYDGSASGVFVSLISDFADGGDATGDELNSIENLGGSAHADDLWGNDGTNVLRGMDGNDSLKGYGGSDTLYGGEGTDELYGMDGMDTLRGEAGGDYLDGGADSDTLYGGDGIDSLLGRAGGDVLYGENDLDTLLGGAGNDLLYGGAGTDALYGEADNDTLDGGAGVDTLTGGTGDDTYYTDTGDVIIEAAGEGHDVVQALANYTLTAGASVEILSLDSGMATIGIGNEFGQTIFGNAGNNVLDGGGGVDVLSGLGGNDTFRFQAGQAHGDQIYEFVGNGGAVGDSLMFVGYGTLAAGASFVQLNATDWQINSADGLHHETISFAGGASIDASDWMFV